MVKVTNPLGSDEAHGQMMKAVIFQGRTAKQYRAPSRTRTAAALAQEAKFKFYNQMICAGRARARFVWRTLLGANWLPLFYKWIEDSFQAWSDLWDQTDPTTQQSWRDAAPIQFNDYDYGEVFFKCYVALVYLMQDKQKGFFELPVDDPVLASDVRDWWLSDLAGVFLVGMYDDDHPDIEFSENNWATIGGAVYYGGYARLSASDPGCWYSFWFIGSWLTIWYKQSPSYAGMSIEIDNYAPIIVSQNGESVLGTVSYTTPKLEYGLHRVTVRRDGQTGGIVFDRFQIEG